MNRQPRVAASRASRIVAGLAVACLLLAACTSASPTPPPSTTPIPAGANPNRRAADADACSHANAARVRCDTVALAQCNCHGTPYYDHGTPSYDPGTGADARTDPSALTNRGPDLGAVGPRPQRPAAGGGWAVAAGRRGRRGHPGPIADPSRRCRYRRTGRGGVYSCQRGPDIPRGDRRSSPCRSKWEGTCPVGRFAGAGPHIAVRPG